MTVFELMGDNEGLLEQFFIPSPRKRQIATRKRMHRNSWNLFYFEGKMSGKFSTSFWTDWNRFEKFMQNSLQKIGNRWNCASSTFYNKKTVPTKFLKMTRIFDTLVSLSLAIFNDFLTEPFFLKMLEHTHIPYFRATIVVFS